MAERARRRRARVVSVRRREPERRPLNLPRPLFTRRGLAGVPRDAAGRADRRSCAASRRRRTRPAARGTSRSSARREGRFRVAAELNGAPQIVCATGFRRGYRQNPLLARLVDEHGLETAEDWIVLAPDSTVPALTDATRTLALAGAPAQWAFPAADTIAGAKYAARGFLARVQACRTR